MAVRDDMDIGHSADMTALFRISFEKKSQGRNVAA